MVRAGKRPGCAPDRERSTNAPPLSPQNLDEFSRQLDPRHHDELWPPTSFASAF